MATFDAGPGTAAPCRRTHPDGGGVEPIGRVNALENRRRNMPFNNALAKLALAGLFSAAIAMPGFAQDAAHPDADNTKVNRRDRSKAEPTADQGKNNKTDRELMKDIRRALVEDKSLSSSAHNVKVIAQGGKVTLKGPVQSEDEKRAVEEKAAGVAGQGNVTNQLTVKAAKAKKTS
jgi:hypothetical protein